MALIVLLATPILGAISGEAAGTVPGGIDRIVFVSDADDPLGDIYVRDFAGSNPIRLTTSIEQDYSPKWSPDGTRIAFARSLGSGGAADLYVMDPDGSNQRNLSNGGGTVNVPLAWSPDGTQILITSNRAGQPDLWIVYADGSNPVQLTNDANNEMDADWSPDGSKIAYDRVSGAETDIWLMNADGSGVMNLTNRPRQNVAPAWSPDGTKIAYDSSFAGDWDVWVIGADGTNPTNLTNLAGFADSAAAWSPDGSKIAFQSSRDGDLDLWMMNPNGSDPAHLTNNPAEEWSVDWESANRVPAATDDKAAVRRGMSVEIAPLSNDSDPDGEVLSVTDITRMPDHGLVVINSSGTVTYTHDGTMSSQSDSFEYEIQDTRLASDRAIVTISIQTGFDDVPDSNPFIGDITWLAGQGITKGCNPPANTLFCPADPVTRGQMAAFLVRALHYTDAGGGNLFVDDNGSVFELDIDRLGTAGVTRGCNPPANDRFCPDELVTRGQMAAFLSRAFRLTDLGMSDLFVDDNGSIFEADIDKLGATGVSRGCNPPLNDRFCPDEPVTREQMAAFIHRAVDYIT
jgi:Tol biopolymer transport system component